MAGTDAPSARQRQSTKLTTASLRDQAQRVIRAQIIAGEFRPGQLYSVGTVAAELGVSVTPVREAVLDLAREGLVEMARNRGFRVREMTDDDLDEIVELRRMIEVSAVRAITARGLLTDATELHQLATTTEESAAAGDWVRFLDNDRDFHLGILAHLGNQRLLQIAGSLRDQSRLYGLDRIAGTKTLLASAHEHTLLLDAITEGREDDAVQLIGQHLQHARGIWAGRDEEGA